MHTFGVSFSSASRSQPIVSTGARCCLRISLTSSYTSSQLAGGWISTSPVQGLTVCFAGWRRAFLTFVPAASSISTSSSNLTFFFRGEVRLLTVTVVSLNVVADVEVSFRRLRFRGDNDLLSVSVSKETSDWTEESEESSSSLSLSSLNKCSGAVGLKV